MSDRLGGGIYLDNQFDFSVSTTGDLRFSNGVNELQKDLSFIMVIILDEYIGKGPSDNLETKILSTASEIAKADTRVTRVNEGKSSVEFDPQEQTIMLELLVETFDGEQALVFEV
jgi:hypothetical protein